jgi:hypothetical protein
VRRELRAKATSLACCRAFVQKPHWGNTL